MAGPQYTAGFQFIVSTPTQTEDKQVRKAIRSHATKAGKARRHVAQLQSWISPNSKLGSPNKTLIEAAPTREPSRSISSPGRFGSAFSGLQLPAGIEPYMIQDLVKLINLDKHGIYPYEICLDVNVTERGWFPYMINDICCLHSMMFSVRAFTDGTSSPNNQLSRAARLHYAQTLQLLQARLNTPDQISAISDSTLMVVFVLASAAELMGDFTALTNHVKGLEKIVSLRGGVRSLNTHNNMHVKVCRADLSYALLTNQPPLLFTANAITYTPYLTTPTGNPFLTPCIHLQHVNPTLNQSLLPPTAANPLQAYLYTTLFPALHAIYLDLHAFSCTSNLAFQTTRKLSPVLYNEIMISALYRLTTLSFAADAAGADTATTADEDGDGEEEHTGGVGIDEDHEIIDEDCNKVRVRELLHETIRLALLLCCTTLYMQRSYMACPYARLVALYHKTLLNLRSATTTTARHTAPLSTSTPTPILQIPAPLLFWLLTLSHLVATPDTNAHAHARTTSSLSPLSPQSSPPSSSPPSANKWTTKTADWLDETIHQANIKTWKQAREMLREMVWVDFVHEGKGRRVWEGAVRRIGEWAGSERGVGV